MSWKIEQKASRYGGSEVSIEKDGQKISLSAPDDADVTLIHALLDDANREMQVPAVVADQNNGLADRALTVLRGVADSAGLPVEDAILQMEMGVAGATYIPAQRIADMYPDWETEKVERFHADVTDLLTGNQKEQVVDQIIRGLVGQWEQNGARGFRIDGADQARVGEENIDYLDAPGL